MKTYYHELLDGCISDAIEFRLDKFRDYANENEYYCEHVNEEEFIQSVWDRFRHLIRVESKVKELKEL